MTVEYELQWQQSEWSLLQMFIWHLIAATHTAGTEHGISLHHIEVGHKGKKPMMIHTRYVGDDDIIGP